jgi:hypothetical protein
LRKAEAERQTDRVRQTDREHALKTIFFFLCGCVRESNIFARKELPETERKKKERK